MSRKQCIAIPQFRPTSYAEPYVAAYLSALEGLPRLAWAILFHAGLHLRELAALRVEDVDRSCRLIHVRHGKDGRERTVPITPALERELRAIERLPDAGYLFGQGETAPSPELLDRRLRSAEQQAGLGRLRLSDVRRTAACFLLRAARRRSRSHRASTRAAS